MQVIPGNTILGEAAAACLVGLDAPGDAVVGSAHHVLGEFHRYRDMDYQVRLEYQRKYLPALCSVITEAVGKAGLEVTDLALVLPHNVNRYSWIQAAAALGIASDRVYLDNVPRTGHCFCADPFVNLADARREGRVESGSHLLLASAGLGATFSAVVLRAAGE